MAIYKLKFHEKQKWFCYKELPLMVFSSKRVTLWGCTELLGAASPFVQIRHVGGAGGTVTRGQ